MPLALLTQIPALYRILAILALIATVFTTGFVKGLNYEHDKLAAKQAEVLEKQMIDASKLNKSLSDQLFNSQAKQAEIASKNATLKSQLAAAINKAPIYISKQCEVSDEVKDNLNEQIKNSWRSKK